MAAFWTVFTFGGSGPALTAHGSLDLKQEIQIQIQIPKYLIFLWTWRTLGAITQRIPSFVVN
jgi:hypothetical protein